MPLLCPVKVAIGERSDDRQRRIDLSWDPMRLWSIVVREGGFLRLIDVRSRCVVNVRNNCDVGARSRK